MKKNVSMTYTSPSLKRTHVYCSSVHANLMCMCSVCSNMWLQGKCATMRLAVYWYRRSLAWMESLYNFSGTELDWLLSQCYAAHTHHLSQQLCCCVAFNMKLWTQKLSTSIVFTLKSSVMHISIPFSPSHPFLLPLLKNPQGWQPCTNMAPFRYYIYSSNGSLRWVQYIFSSNASYVHSLSSCE